MRMPDGYDIIVNDLINKNPKHKFIRIHPTDVKATLRAVFTSLPSQSVMGIYTKRGHLIAYLRVILTAKFGY